MTISTVGWIVVGVAAWSVVATAVGVLIGRVLNNRDRQVPRDDSVRPVQGIPTQSQDSSSVTSRPRVVGRGRQRPP